MVKAESPLHNPNYLQFELTPQGVQHVTFSQEQDGNITFSHHPADTGSIDHQLAAYLAIVYPDGTIETANIMDAIGKVVESRRRIEALGEPLKTLQLHYPNLAPISVYCWREESLKGLDVIGQTMGRFDSAFPGIVGNYLTNIFLMPADSETVVAADGRKQSGNTHLGTGGIELFPRAFEEDEYRIPGVGNLEGVVIHEPFHLFAFMPWSSPIFADFMEAAGWAAQITEKGFEEQRGGRFVSDYAASNSGEDFCESHVALLKNPDLLQTVNTAIFDFFTKRYGQDIAARFEEGMNPSVFMKCKIAQSFGPPRFQFDWYRGWRKNEVEGPTCPVESPP